MNPVYEVRPLQRYQLFCDGRLIGDFPSRESADAFQKQMEAQDIIFSEESAAA